MITRNIVQLAYGIPGILTYFLVFYAMIGIRKTLSPSFIFVYVIMAITVRIYLKYFLTAPLSGP